MLTPVRTRGLALLAVFFGSLVAGCARGPERSHVPLGAGAEPLRSQFNRDVGKTRIVMVAAPT